MMHGLGFGMGLWMLIPLVLLGAGIYAAARLIYHRSEPSGRNRELPPETQVYKLAASHKGVLTVSDLVVAMGMESAAAEKLLQSMVDHQRVQMEVRDDGRVVYEFPELLQPVDPAF